MIQAILGLWLVSALLVVFEGRIYRIIIYFGIFSLITSMAYLLLGAPDVAMAEAGISAFVTIFFIICIEKHYSCKDAGESKKRPLWRYVLPLSFCAGLLALFLLHMPGYDASAYLKYQFLYSFRADVGGENAVTAIYLGYRVYDTLFEALILVIAVVAVAHLSFFEGSTVQNGRGSEVKSVGMAIFTMRFITPLILVFGAYLVANGHITAGGGFQGGLAIATFFICRYMSYDIYDISVHKVQRLEELVFISIIAVTIFAVFLGAAAYMPTELLPIYQDIYLIIMNFLIGVKVAAGFFVLFYRYIAIERG